MMSNQTLLDDLSKVKARILSDLLKARKGDIIDISKLPDQLFKLHNRVKDLAEEDRAPLVAAFEEVLEALDELSKEIQQRFNDISGQIKTLDPSPNDNKE